MKKIEPPTQAEIVEARIWWNELPDHYKAHLSIWNILALYAAHWSRVHTVSFDADEKPRLIDS